MPQKYIADIVGISEHTMVEWGKFIRQTMARYLSTNPLVLGKVFPVQIDESLSVGNVNIIKGVMQNMKNLGYLASPKNSLISV